MLRIFEKIVDNYKVDPGKLDTLVLRKGLNKYSGKARHSDLMNMSHMKKREFKECVESLIEREAITVDTHTDPNNKVARMYVLNADIRHSWGQSGQ